MDIIMLLTAIGGGIFGATLGALPAFILTGFVAIAGNVVVACGGTADILGGVAFGSFLGPHIAFAGGVAAAAWAHRYGELEAGGDILTPLAKYSSMKPILVGGVFGGIGYLLNYLFAGVLALPTDTVALTVVVSGFIARFVIGKTGPIGKCEEKTRAFFPEAGMFGFLVVFGLGLGAVVSQITVSTGLVTLGFGISAASLIFAQAGFPAPASHHISLVAALAASATGNIFIGALFGAFAAVLCEVYQRTFNSYCDSHIDPPAFTIFTLAFIILGLM